MTTPRVRSATPEDADRLAAVYRSAYAENRRLGFPTKAAFATGADVTEWMEQSRVYVATVRERVVGGVRLEATDEDRVKLSRLAVHEDWKGEGIGSRLLDRAEAVVREWGYGTVWLTTPPEHPFLVDVYRSRGYEVTGEYPLEYRDYDEVVMEKSLASSADGSP